MYEEEVSFYVPKGFVLANFFSRKTSSTRGGGCSIYLRPNIEFKTIDVKSFCTESVFEVAGILLPKPKIVIVTLYRTPDSNIKNFLEIFESFLFFLNNSYSNCQYIISSDFNINLRVNNTMVQSFCNLLRSFNTYWLNEEPTRGEACLDNIVTSINKDLIKCKVVEPHISDHCGVFALFHGLNVVGNKTDYLITRSIRDLSPQAISNFKNGLLQINWSILNSFLNVEEAFNFFMTTLTDLFNQHCKVREIKVSSKPRKNKLKWLSPELLKIRQFKLALYDRYKNNKGTVWEPNYRTDYLKAKNLFRIKIDEAKRLENESYIANSKNKCKAAWNVVKTESNLKKQTDNILIESSIFNDYFVNLVDDLDLSSNQCISNGRARELVDSFVRYKNFDCNLTFKWREINSSDVLKFVSSLSSSVSLDYYGFSNKTVKNIIDVIVSPLTFLLNRLLEQGVYPEALKITKVSPIYKKGDKLNPSSYRPISLVPIFSKIFEGCIKQQLHSFFTQNNLYSTDQYGFIPGGSTIKAVEAVVENVLMNFENRLVSSAILIDLTKAFDCINHNLLLDKFHSYGIRGNELNLLKSYLNERKQMVVQYNDKSSFKNITIGVPQGSVLGPFLFVIAVNDFSYSVPCKSMLYADDTTLMNSTHYLDDLINKENSSLQSALEWFEANLLVVNQQKTEKIVFSLNSNIIKNTTSVKLLGIVLDNKLNWDHHVDQLCRKLSRVVFLLRKLRNSISTDILLTVYNALFQSQLRYGVVLWGNSSSAQRALIWQKKALRTIKNIPDRESCFPIFKEYKIMSLPNLYIFCNLLNVKETLSSFATRQEYHMYNTRNKYLLDLLRVRLEKTKCSHMYMKIVLFNKLPVTAWLVSVKRFKIVLEHWLKENVFYSVSDFLACDINNTLIF